MKRVTFKCKFSFNLHKMTKLNVKARKFTFLDKSCLFTIISIVTLNNKKRNFFVDDIYSFFKMVKRDMNIFFQWFYILDPS